MLKLIRLILPAILVAASSPIAGSAQTDDCVRFAAQPDRLSLVRTVRVSDAERLSPVIDVKRTGTKNLGDFLTKGGSLVLVDSQGGNVGIVNRDTLDASALDSDAQFVKVSIDAVAEVGDGSIPATTTRTLTNVAEVPNRWVFEPNTIRRGESTDLGNLRGPGTNPNGMEIGDFDGVAAPTVVIGENDAVPAPTPTAGLIAAQTPEALALNATVAIYFRDRDDATKISTCNGTQVGPGLILTNLHCASQRHVGHVVHFGPLNVQPDTLLPGAPVSGSVRCRATVVSPYPQQSPRLDFALLRIAGAIPAPYATAIVPLDDGSGLAANTAAASSNLSATQIQYWLTNATSGRSLQYQKYLMRPPMCAITRDDGLDPHSSYFCNSDGLDAADQIDPRGIGHLCDSERGSSGSPLFDQEFGRILALHRGGGEFLEVRNCAVPAKQIRAQLTAWGYLQG